MKEERALLVDTSTAPGAPEDESEEAPPPKKAKGLAAIRGEMPKKASITKLSPAEIVNKEITMYADLPLEESTCDPLDWWRENVRKFPRLLQVVKKYLCICGTSVPSERVFSAGGLIVDPHRARLLPVRVNMLLFLAKNLP